MFFCSFLLFSFWFLIGYYHLTRYLCFPHFFGKRKVIWLAFWWLCFAKMIFVKSSLYFFPTTISWGPNFLAIFSFFSLLSLVRSSETVFSSYIFFVGVFILVMFILSFDNLLNKSSTFLFCYGLLQRFDFLVEISALIYFSYIFGRNTSLIAVNCAIIF